MKDYTGVRRGKLTVIGYDIEKKKWKCQCECGGVAYFTSHQWIADEPRTCGCYKRRKDISGNRYGQLVAVKPTGNIDKHGSAQWVCKCDCGNEVIVSLRHLRNGEVKSCGCLKVPTGQRLGETTRKHCVDGSDPYKLIGTAPRKNNKSGYRGVYYDKEKRKYAATIWFKRKRYRLGRFDTAEEAYEAYLKKKEELHSQYLKEYAEEYPEEWQKVLASSTKKGR